MAANSNAPVPSKVAIRPALGLLASINIAWMALAPVSPSKSLMDIATCPATASRPNTKPAIAIAMTISGPIEKTE